MNNADFITQPNGFPLESDATLGFMQSDYQSAIRALAKAIGSANVILTGLNVVNGVATDGWILYDGDLVFFQGGTVSTFFIIETTVTAKANQNGASVDRYFVKKARFGTGTGQVAFSFLTRISSLNKIAVVLNMFGNAGNGFGVNWIVLSGLKPLGNGVDSGTAIFADRIIDVPAYQTTVVNVANPIYLKPDGTWTTTADADYLKFEPYTKRRLDTLNQKHTTKVGEIRFVVTAELDMNMFVAGLGRWDWDGFAIANGNNGTVDLTTAFASLTGLQRI